jgi:hypothetical protein
VLALGVLRLPALGVLRLLNWGGGSLSTVSGKGLAAPFPELGPQGPWLGSNRGGFPRVLRLGGFYGKLPLETLYKTRVGGLRRGVPLGGEGGILCPYCFPLSGNILPERGE